MLIAASRRRLLKGVVCVREDRTLSEDSLTFRCSSRIDVSQFWMVVGLVFSLMDKFKVLSGFVVLEEALPAAKDFTEEFDVLH